MIYDCFQFFNELDVIEIRFKELYDHVDFFILSESPTTHSGKPKPLYFAENKQRFAPFLDKIIHLTPDLPAAPEAGLDEHWTRENHQRNFIATELDKRCSDEDVIFITDADEITRGSKVAEIAAGIDGSTLYCLNMIPSNYFLNMQSHQTWTMGKVLRYKQLKNYKNLTHVRNSTQTGVAYNAGWHFSYMGGMERVRQKLTSFAHQELNMPAIVSDENLTLAIRSQVSCWHLPQQPVVEKQNASFSTNLPPADFSPFWRYYRPEIADLPKCVHEYPHMLTDIHFSTYYFDNFENLYYLAKEYKGLPGAVVELNSFEGYMSRYIANIFPDVVHCVDKWEDDKTFLTNMHNLTDGNYRIHNTDAIEFLTNFDGKIKFLYVDRRYEADFLKKVIDLFLSKAADKAVICGYDFCNEEVRKALFSTWPEMDTSGRFWFRQIS